jgi:hypothetical protein
MNSRKAFVSVAKGVGLVSVLFLLVATALHPSRPLQLASLGTATGCLALLAARLAAKRPRMSRWVGGFSLLLVGASIWWIIWVPHLFLPVPLQVASRTLGVGVGLIAAAGLYRFLPKRLKVLGWLFPALLLALTFVLPCGPERWDLGLWTPDEVQFTPHGKLLVRTEEGPVLLYDFPSGTVEAVLASSAPSVGGPPTFGTTLPGWTFGLAALESEGRVRVQTFPPAAGWPESGHEYAIQTGPTPIAITSGPKSTFLAVYQTFEGKAWVELKDLYWNTVSGPIELPGFLGAVLEGPWKRALSDLLGAIAIPADARTKLAYLGISTKGLDVRVVDLATGESRIIDISQELVEAGGGEKSYVGTIAFSPDGEVLALGLSWKGEAMPPGLVWLVDLEGRVLARFLTPTQEELGGDPYISELAFSPDGKMIAAQIGYIVSRLSVIQVDSGAVQDLPLGDRGFGEIAFSQDGEYLVAAAYDGIYRWRIGR